MCLARGDDLGRGDGKRQIIELRGGGTAESSYTALYSFTVTITWLTGALGRLARVGRGREGRPRGQGGDPHCGGREGAWGQAGGARRECPRYWGEEWVAQPYVCVGVGVDMS